MITVTYQYYETDVTLLLYQQAVQTLETDTLSPAIIFNYLFELQSSKCTTQ